MMYNCALCACPSFDSTSSLLDHLLIYHVSRRASDPSTYGIKSLNDDQWDYLIKVELILRECFPDLKNIHVAFTDYFSDRYCVVIRALRKLAIYKLKLAEIKSSFTSIRNESINWDLLVITDFADDMPSLELIEGNPIGFERQSSLL